jgi:hypothetical protein
MPDKSAGQSITTAANYLQQAREAMDLAERAKSVALREELLKLAMNWLKLAGDAEKH